MPLHTDFRPDDLEQFYGNSDVKQVLQNFFSRNKSEIPHAFLFSGPRGCGKTTLGRIVAKKLGCDLQYDFMELDAASFRGIDTVREIRKRISYRPIKGECRVWFLDECHQLTKDAQEALLKDVEHPPEHVYFIFSTTDPQDLKPTLVDRCVHLQVAPLDEKECSLLLRRVCRKLGKRISPQIIAKIAELAEGRPRTALVHLEKIIDLENESQMLDVLKQSEQYEAQIIDLCRALMKRTSWTRIAKILKGLEKEDPEGVRRAVLGYCSKILLNEDNVRAFEVMSCFIEPVYNSGWPGIVLACYEANAEVD